MHQKAIFPAIVILRIFDSNDWAAFLNVSDKQYRTLKKGKLIELFVQ